MVKLSLVDAKTAREKLGRWYEALSARRFDELASLMAEIGDENIVVEYPQSGERIRGRENNLAVLVNYPSPPQATVKDIHGSDDRWVLTPSWTPLRITGTGDHYVVESRITYPNGEVWSSVDLFELKNDKVVKVTEYFGAPFPAAEWRAKWVERIESPSR